MKAWVLHEVDNLCFEEVECPAPKKDEVLLSVKACGICGSDIPRIYSTGAHKMPLIPGHEFSGEVVQTGSEVDKRWLGKHVGVFPLIPCRVCPSCSRVEYELCYHYNYLGSRCNGGFSEYVAVPAWNLVELPDGISYSEAAMLEPMAVAVHAIRRIHPDCSDAILIYGAGTIGLLLSMFLLMYGQKNLFVIGNKLFQKEILLDMGLSADHFCNSKEEDVLSWISSQTNHQGPDAVFECVGKNDTISHAVQCANRGGRICMIGNPHTDIMMDKNVYWGILKKQLTITGSWNSSFKTSDHDDWTYVLQKLYQGAIHPRHLITHSFPLDRLEEGLHIMRDKSQNHVKIMMTR